MTRKFSVQNTSCSLSDKNTAVNSLFWLKYSGYGIETVLSVTVSPQWSASNSLWFGIVAAASVKSIARTLTSIYCTINVFDRLSHANAVVQGTVIVRAVSAFYTESLKSPLSKKPNPLNIQSPKLARLLLPW
jgi:hypothetical protein